MELLDTSYCRRQRILRGTRQRHEDLVPKDLAASAALNASKPAAAKNWKGLSEAGSTSIYFSYLSLYICH